MCFEIDLIFGLDDPIYIKWGVEKNKNIKTNSDNIKLEHKNKIKNKKNQ